MQLCFHAQSCDGISRCTSSNLTSLVSCVCQLMDACFVHRGAQLCKCSICAYRKWVPITTHMPYSLMHRVVGVLKSYMYTFQHVWHEAVEQDHCFDCAECCAQHSICWYCNVHCSIIVTKTGAEIVPGSMMRLLMLQCVLQHSCDELWGKALLKLCFSH